MTTSDKQVRPFADFLVEQRSGRTHTELGEALNELVEAVADTGKSGTLTLTLKVKPAGKAEGMVTIVDDVIVKPPKGERGEAIYFIDANHNLTRHNPAQQTLPLREVPAPEAPTAENLKEARS